MKKIDRHKKFNMAKWTKDHDTANKRRRDAIIFYIKHPIVWFAIVIVATWITELFK